MAKLPEAVYRTTPVGPVNQAKMGYYGQGQGLQKLGETLGVIGDMLFESEVSKASSDASNELLLYSDYLKNGTIDEQGAIVPAPDPSLKFSMYQKKVEEIQGRVRSQYGDGTRLYRKFSSDFGRLALVQGLEVKSNALTGLRSQIKANTDSTLVSLAVSASQATDPATKNRLHSQALSVIDNMVITGAFSPEEAENQKQQFTTMLARAQIREDIRNNSDAALDRLLEGGYEGLDPNENQKWIDTAIRKSEVNLKERIALEERSYRLSERAKGALQDDTAKEGFELDAKKELTTEWVIHRKDALDPEVYKYLLKRSTGETRPAVTDTETYADLRIAASEGVDIRGMAKKELIRGNVSVGEFNTLVSEVESRSPEVISAQWFKNGEDYIKEALRVSDVNPSIADKQLRARILDEWRSWARGHSDASPSEAEEVYTRMADSATLIKYKRITAALPEPMFFTGTRSIPDLKETWRRTKAAYANGDIDQWDFDNQVKLISEWKQATEKQVEGKSNAVQ